MLKKTLIFLLTLAVALAFSSCDDEKDKDSGYRYTYTEIAFDLPYDYTEAKSDSFDAFFTNGEAFIGVSRLSFAGVENDDLDGSMYPDKVAEKYAEKNSLDVTIENRETYSYFAYSDGGYFSVIAFYRSKYAHFIVKFMCIEEQRGEFESEFLKYADGAKFIK